MKYWAIVACDETGTTVDAVGRDPDRLADRVASWAQQEADRWSEMGLIYMLAPLQAVMTPREAAQVRAIIDAEDDAAPAGQ